MSDEISHGLEDVIVDESKLSYIDGDMGELIYRGYSIEQLAQKASFEEVIHLLWHGSLPDQSEMDSFASQMRSERTIAPEIIETLQNLAALQEEPMAALRTGVSMLSASDTKSTTTTHNIETILGTGRRIAAKLPTVLAAYERLRNDAEPIEPHDNLGFAENFLYMLTGEPPNEVAAETFDTALTLHADHGLNASTFTTMTIASTQADPYSAVTGGIGALSGPLHGGANQDVMRTLQELDASDKKPLDWTKQALAEGRRIPGWGHRVYNTKDPRAVILESRSAALAKETGDTKWHDYTQTIERYLTEEEELPEQGIAPNVDFYSGSVYYQLGIPIDLYTPIFAMSRVAGWIAHIHEYVSDNRLIRPRGRYVGPEQREFVPIEKR